MRRRLTKLVEPQLSNPTLVLAFEGWNDAGEAASTALGYAADQLAMVPLAEIESDEFYDLTVQRPQVEMDKEGSREIRWPSTRFRFGPIRDDQDLIVAVGPEPHLGWRLYSDLIVEYATSLGVKRVLILGAFLADVVYSRPIQVTGFGSEPDCLQKLGLQPNQYEGPTGIAGVLAERFRQEGFEELSLWAGLAHYITLSPNPRGALALLQRMAAALDLKLDMEPLSSQAAEFEEQVSALVAADPELSEYVRQLKRREFAQ